tara:strand:- start:1489 stop:2187 length:699 start_codon:yes stop_codon:yes gene_type:complete
MSVKYIENDIHNEILNIPSDTFNLIYTSPPYAITEAEWDKPLKWDILFPEMWRVLKPNGIIVLHASMPFTYELLKYQTPKYHYTWIKNRKTNFFKAKLQPLRQTEEIFIYYNNPGTYNPQMIGNEVFKKRYVKQGNNNNKYYGQRTNIQKTYVSEEETHKGRYPSTILEYPVRVDNTGISRTDNMIDFFIKTYSNEGDNILDLTCHNNYVGDRCKLLNRNYLGIDIKLELNN